MRRHILKTNFGIKIRHCFFKADKSKMVNCVSALAVAQHIEAPINTNNNYPNNQKGVLLSRLIFFAGVEISGRFLHSSPDCLGMDFFNR
jgi:hypothetical protein